MLATSAVLALLFAQPPEADKFRGLRPDALRFIDAAATASQRPDAGSSQKVKDLADVLVRQDISGHTIQDRPIGPVVPMPKPQPATPPPAPAPKSAEISKKLEQADPATRKALEAFATEIRKDPEHPTEALVDLMKTGSPNLKRALAPLAPGK